MAKGTSKPKPKHKPADKEAFKPRVHVRMYLHGLGDCFLLRFETEEDHFCDVLIDCGIYKASPDASELMNEVVDDVIKTTGNRLDVLVVTHEHWDHISGFSQALKKFKSMKIGEVWQAWTENPKDPLAKELRKKYENSATALVHLARTAARAHGATPAPALDDAFSVLGFFGIDKEGDEGDAYDKIREFLASNNPRYFLPGAVEPLGTTGVKVFVLGPPANETTLRSENIAKKDAYEKQLAFFEGFDALLGAVGAGLSDDPQADRANRPFRLNQEIPFDAARESEFFQNMYAFAPHHPEAFRSIDDLAHDSIGQLALRMDRYINNTSLVLAFRLPSGQVLLFPGDAQGGNWKSWADPKQPLKFESERTDAHELLARTVLYKVAHHGSHNATPRTYGLELMTHPELRALVPVDHAIAEQARYGEMPLVAIMNALRTKTGGAVFRSDGARDDLPEGAFRFAEKELSIRTTKDGTPFERPLYCETAFDLD